jgi:UDP-N-acetylglucosamine transferase subunit ALG13
MTEMIGVPPVKRRHVKLGLICTVGGHFEQMLNLSDVYLPYDHFWITNANKQTTSQLVGERKYFIRAAHFKQPWTYGAQIPGIVKAFLRERPTHLLSTGSGRTALIPFLLAKAFQLPFLHVDTFSRVNGFSKFGSFLLRLHHKIFCQWESTEANAVYIGPIFKADRQVEKPAEPTHVFVSVGTRTEPFSRLLSAVDALIVEGSIKDNVVVQAGHTKFNSPNLTLFDFCSPDVIDDLILKARYVITQESAGIGTKCLKSDTRFIVMPRDYAHGELPTRSDMREDLHLKLEELGYTKVVHDVAQLREAVRHSDSIRTGFAFDNTLAVTTLKNVLEAS